MKQISITSVQVAHFRSFVEPTVIDLTTQPGLKLITGDNQLEPRLGANGCGKSTIWDAMCFALYGSSVKGLRAADLITHGYQAAEVALFFTLDGKEHFLHRVSPPMRIYLDGDQVEQDAVDRLIGLSKARFLNSVVFGQATPLFLDLPVPARGDLLDEVLDLELWMHAADKASEKHRLAGHQLTECRAAIAMTTGRIEGLGDPERFRAMMDAWEQQQSVRLNAIINEVDALEKAHAELSEQLTDLTPVDEEEEREHYEVLRDTHVRARERAVKLDVELSAIIQDMDFLSENDICPTCEQPITEAHKNAHNERMLPRWRELKSDSEIAHLDVETTGAELPACELTWRSIVRKNQEIRSTKMLLERQMADKQHDMDRLEKEAEWLSQETNPIAAEAERAARERDRLTVLLEQQKTAESTMTSGLAALDYWRKGFGKVRLFCIDTVLQELAVETRNALLALGLADWHIDFTTATETKSGTTRLGVQVDIRAPVGQAEFATPQARKFEMMSGGESQRARLAVSLGLANLIQRWAGVRFDLEVFDEPTQFLSETGIEDLLEALRTRAEINERSIWVCDHRALIYSGFNEVMNIVKTAEGSRIAA